MAEDVERILTGVGPRLRDLRERRGLTLAQAAASAETSISTLSRLESGTRKPTLDLLIPLARLYEVAMDDIVGAPPTGDPRIRPRPVARDGMIYVALTRSGAPVQAFKLILPGRNDSRLPGQQTHEGYEWLYVLSGTLDLHLADAHTTLQAGDAAEFDTRTPHCITGADDRPVELLVLVSPQGERIHLGGA